MAGFSKFSFFAMFRFHTFLRVMESQLLRGGTSSSDYLLLLSPRCFLPSFSLVKTFWIASVLFQSVFLYFGKKRVKKKSTRAGGIQQTGGPCGPTATSRYALCLARSLEVSQISTRFHVTETLPVVFPPLLSPPFCLPSQVLSGPVKALWIVSNLIVLILLPVHARRKSAHRVGFPLCDGPL